MHCVTVFYLMYIKGCSANFNFQCLFTFTTQRRKAKLNLETNIIVGVSKYGRTRPIQNFLHHIQNKFRLPTTNTIKI